MRRNNIHRSQFTVFHCTAFVFLCRSPTHGNSTLSGDHCFCWWLAENDHRGQGRRSLCQVWTGRGSNCKHMLADCSVFSNILDATTYRIQLNSNTSRKIGEPVKQHNALNKFEHVKCSRIAFIFFVELNAAGRERWHQKTARWILQRICIRQVHWQGLDWPGYLSGAPC